MTVITEFSIDGEQLCIDFANTLDDRSTDAPIERLGGYSDLLQFGLVTESIDSSVADQLSELATQQPRNAEEVRLSAITLREAVYRVLAEHAAGETPDQTDLECINQAISQAANHGRIELANGQFAWRWQEDPLELERPIWPIIDSIRDFLLNGDLDRLHVCAAEDCQWLFYDTSRNRSRKWCDMETCGNRAKINRYRKRHSDES